MIKDYKVLMAYDESELKKKIMEHLSAGWMLQGGIGVDHGAGVWAFAQAVIKRGKDIEMSEWKNSGTTLGRAITVVMDLAAQNIVTNDPDMKEDEEEQATAVEVVHDFLIENKFTYTDGNYLEK